MISEKKSHSQKFIDQKKQRLLDLQDQLINLVEGTTKDLQNSVDSSHGASSLHKGDAGTDTYDQDFALSVLSMENDALYEIREALERIKTGVYGICEVSGTLISEVRLEALPFTRYSIEVQKQREDEKLTRATENPTNIGFSGIH